MLVAAPAHVETDSAPAAHEAELIDGKAIAQTIRKEVAAEVAKLHDKYGKVLFGNFCYSSNICLTAEKLMIHSGLLY